MQISLTDDDARELHALLRDYLPQLHMEVARTEARDFRHELVKRQDVCERVLELLNGVSVGSPPSN
jgi:hypothetical protein